MESWNRLIREKQKVRTKELKDRKGTDQHLVRESNRVLVLNYIRERGTVSRSDLAPYTGLSRTAIGNIVDDLIREGIVLQEEHRVGDDRRTNLLSFNATAAYVLGGTLGSRHLSIVLADLSGQPRQHLEVPFSLNKGPEEGLPLLGKLLKVFVAQQQVAWDMIVGLGLGIVRPLASFPQKTPLPAPLARWTNVDIQQALTDELGIPVYLDHDGNMGALGESRYGAGRNEDNIIYLNVGSTISGGLLLNHDIYRGYAGIAGEIGHIPVDLNGHLCHCGRSGCLETIASKSGILQEVQRFFPSLTTLPQVIEAAQNGNVTCAGALERAGRYLGVALASLINLLNPSLIVLDGSVIQAGELVMQALRTSAENHSLPASFAHTRITPAECNGLAMSLGSIATILDAIFL
jgi:predicted NBD/HSP70 family sugar kinase/DNA-binding MarR family transcriptional regulator